MSSNPTRAPSIRGRLLGYLLLPLVLLLIASIWADHRTYVTPMYDMFDRALSHAAVSIASHVQKAPDGHLYVERQDPGPPLLHGPGHGPLPPPPGDEPFAKDRPPERFDPEYRPMSWMRLYSGARESFVYRVSMADGSTLAGDESLPIAVGEIIDNLTYGDVHHRGLLFRTASYHTIVAGAPIIVTVGETVHRRDTVVRRLDTVVGLSDGIQLLLVFGVCMFGITVALRPINRLRDQITRREPSSLQPLPLEPVPGEVRPLVKSLNTLLVTVRDSTLAQQHFLTNAAHQLRTPLTGLKAQLEVLASETRDSAQQERISRLQGSVDRLAHTANQLLALARAEPSAHGPGDSVEIQLGTLIEAVVGSMLDRALAHDIDLGAECEAAQVHGVYWLLHELLINLVDNAIRHTPRGGNITLRCGLHQNAPYLEVEDSGPGIPPAERERVRERFYRAAGSDGQSSGLGLAIVEEIARSHRARFEILDAREGTGARMRITFPGP
ncbi:sensor histidine kinase [Dyella mobilis]|uniref:histidine kinase n=1 Tax=Dyella mobilis TaxID=1849582 RepID=A0ABS2KDX3_9GAMM|nr:ATP-binding protein [Dyella mobilis]MBM7128543.1 sensor histidine kinase N-terminal domain-containing protein [Dyella mobilis]GLQ99554.1 sensor histidine kinase [Dyella mobilis]